MRSNVLDSVVSTLIVAWFALLLAVVITLAACAIEGRIDVGTTPPRSPCPQAE